MRNYYYLLRGKHLCEFDIPDPIISDNGGLVYADYLSTNLSGEREEVHLSEFAILKFRYKPRWFTGRVLNIDINNPYTLNRDIKKIFGENTQYEEMMRIMNPGVKNININMRAPSYYDGLEDERKISR